VLLLDFRSLPLERRSLFLVLGVSGGHSELADNEDESRKNEECGDEDPYGQC
jgi:hypothetical protein